MTDYIAGRNPFREAVQHYSDGIKQIYISPAAASADNLLEPLKKASRLGIPQETSSDAQLAQLVSTNNHQGIVASIKPLVTRNLQQFLDSQMKRDGYRRLIFLDQIQDPVNLGKIIRLSLHFAVDGLIKTRHNSAPLTPTAITTSAGAAFRLPLVEVTNIQQSFSQLQEAGYWTVGTVPGAEKNLPDLPLDRHLVYFFGNEGSGLRRLTKQLCDYLVKIPSPGNFDSLNVATAAGIVVYALQPPEVFGDVDKTV